MYCLIFPNSDASHVRPHFIRFIVNLEEVGTYAWGAALLAHLQHSLENYGLGKPLGCTWVMLGFFLLCLKKLREKLKIELIMDTLRVPMLPQIMNAARPVSKDRKRNIVLGNEILEEVFTWTKKVVEQVEAILRSFLWSGGTEVTKKSVVNWKKCYKPFKISQLKFGPGLAYKSGVRRL